MSSLNETLQSEWRAEALKQLRAYTRKLGTKSKYKTVFRKKRYLNLKKTDDGLLLFGKAPNAGRLLGVNVPVDEWKHTEKSVRFFDDKTHRFRMADEIQIHSSDVSGVDNIHVFAPKYDSAKKYGFFGHRRNDQMIVFQCTDKGPMRVSADPFPDVIMSEHEDDIQKIINDSFRLVMIRHDII